MPNNDSEECAKGMGKTSNVFKAMNLMKSFVAVKMFLKQSICSSYIKYKMLYLLYELVIFFRLLMDLLRFSPCKNLKDY